MFVDVRPADNIQFSTCGGLNSWHNYLCGSWVIFNFKEESSLPPPPSPLAVFGLHPVEDFLEISSRLFQAVSSVSFLFATHSLYFSSESFSKAPVNRILLPLCYQLGDLASVGVVAQAFVGSYPQASFFSSSPNRSLWILSVYQTIPGFLIG